MWSVKFEVWSAKSAVCSVRCGVSREGHGRDRLSLNYRSFMFGKLPPPACPGLCYVPDASRVTYKIVKRGHIPLKWYRGTRSLRQGMTRQRSLKPVDNHVSYRAINLDKNLPWSLLGDVLPLEYCKRMHSNAQYKNLRGSNPRRATYFQLYQTHSTLRI